MADFYVNYGSKNAKLLGNFKLGKMNIKLHDIGRCYVVSKNRKIMFEHVVFYEAMKYFSNLIEFEFSDLLTFNS